MKVLKIRDSYLFDGNPNKSHWCLVYEPKGKKPYIRELTHLYEPSAKNFAKVKSGLLTACKVKGFDTPSGACGVSYGHKGRAYTSKGLNSNVVAYKSGKGWWKPLRRK